MKPITRIHDRSLTLWQSSVIAAVHSNLKAENSQVDMTSVHSHPMVQAVSDHIQAVIKGESIPKPSSSDSAEYSPYLSSLLFEIAKSKENKSGDTDQTDRIKDLEEEVRKYSTKDPNFITVCEENYLYYTTLHGQHLYNSWKENPKGLQFSVIDYGLSDDAVVAVLGDWGTGLDDATQMLKTLMLQHKPDAIIHLGDIYYAGTPIGTPHSPKIHGECQNNFLDIFTDVFNETLGQGKRIPVFTLPGNHEYYSGGVGYYKEVLPAINSGIPSAEQPASYFCLRTKDGVWQFLGMDTGYHDNNPAFQLDPFVLGPSLHECEQTWHNDKLEHFSGKTILLSHHQLFSANARINGRLREYPPNINTFLRDGFEPHFPKIAGWLWGHEHNLVLFKNDIPGFPKGRLIGCSSYEETSGENPYTVNYPGFPYLDPTKYQLGKSEGYMNHGYAIIDFQRKLKNDPIKISYYQYPSWSGIKPNPPTTSEIIHSEPLDIPE